MMKKNRLIFFFSFFAIAGYAQQNDVLLTITGDGIRREVSKDEFSRIYAKNNAAVQDKKKSVEDYLELFVNFKLKVTEAEYQGYDTTSSFINEFKGYRDQLAKPYLTSEAITKKYIDEAYAFSREEVRLSHIMMHLDFATASPADTLAVYNKMLDLRKRIIAGEDFAVVAKEASQDPSVHRNGGDVGFFTVFKFPYSFEAKAYSMKLNELSMPFKTNFGYHIIKVTGRRPAQGRVRVAHIMKVTPPEMTQKQIDSVQKEIYAIYEQLFNGMSFAQAAKDFSDDRRTGEMGGELPWFGTGRMIPEFEEAAFSLTTPGTFTQPVKTMYGWHIIYLHEKEDPLSFEQAKTTIENNVAKGERAELIKKEFIQQLLIENNVQIIRKNLAELYKLDTAYFVGTKNHAEIKSSTKPVLVFPAKTYTVSDFKDYLFNHSVNHSWKNYPLQHHVHVVFDKFIDDMVMAYEDAHLEDKHETFKYLLEEYHDGILLFNIMDDKVWSKAVKDTAGLKIFYENNTDRYMWPDRVEACVYECSSLKLANIIASMSVTRQKKDRSCADIVKTACTKTKEKDTAMLETGKYTRGMHAILDTIPWKVGVSQVIKKQGKYFVIEILSVLPPQPKNLNEARGLVISDYQDYLEKKWIAELKKKYSVQVNNDVLSTLTQ